MFAANVGSLTSLHGINDCFVQFLQIDLIRLSCLRDFALHDSMFKFNAECRSDAHARHLFYTYTSFQLLIHC